MIRPAKFGDIIGIVALISEMYERSPYVGRDEVDEKAAKSLVMQCVQRHGLMTAGGSCVFVCERDGEITGFIAGVLDRVYHVGKKLMATDLYFYCTKKAGPRDFATLFRAFEGWAESNENVIEIKPGITDTVGDDPERLARFYERKGYRRTGLMLIRSIER